MFRKMSLQYARSGEDVNQQVTRDARVNILSNALIRDSDRSPTAKAPLVIIAVTPSIIAV